MPADVTLYARMLAHRHKRAIRVSTHQRVAIKEDALVLNFLAMAGEGDTMHIVSLGRLHEAPAVRCIPDPRIRAQQHRLYRWLSEKLDEYFRWCLTHDTYPQVWIPSATALEHLRHIAEAIRWRQNEPLVHRLADYLSYLVFRAETAGQQAIMLTSQVLAAHFVTPQSPSDDEHLGTMLCWIDPPPIMPIETAIAKVEQQPVGVKTRPDFDQDTLIPLVSAFNHARRTGDQSQGVAFAARIRHALEPIVVRIHDLVTQGVVLLQNENLPMLPDLEEIETQETREFQFFMSGLDGEVSYRPTSTDSTRQAIYALTKREHAQESLEHTLIRGDAFAREQARQSGKLVTGEVVRSEVLRSDKRRHYEFELHTTQKLLSVRPGDELRQLDDSRFMVRVESMRAHTTQGSLLVCRVIKGQRVYGLPEPGERLDLSSFRTTWSDLGRDMGRIKRRLKHDHSFGQRDPRSRRTTNPPSHLLDLVEHLQ